MSLASSNRYRSSQDKDPINLPAVAATVRAMWLALTSDLVIARTPRFRATQRHGIRVAARHGMVLVLVSAVINCIWLVSYHPAAFALVLGLNLSLAATAALAYLAIITVARRYPSAVAFGILLAVDAATLTLGVFQGEFGLIAAGYLLLLPTVVALVLPWATRTHITWLVLHATLVVGYSLFAPEAAQLGGRTALLGLLAVATLVSQFGHMSGLRARVVSFLQIEHIRGMNRHERRNQARLDRLNRILETSAKTDELTGLKNRLALRLDLSVARSRIERHGERYGVLMLDLDRFKAINDSLGHVAGDRVLRATADAVLKTLRPGDGAYRYGGEEFAVIMRVSQPQEAVQAAERIRRAVEGLAVPNPDNPPHALVTISIGVAAVGPSGLTESDDAWLARADVALYRAKAMGRNRCEVDPSSIPDGESRDPASPYAGPVLQTSSIGAGRPSR